VIFMMSRRLPQFLLSELDFRKKTTLAASWLNQAEDPTLFVSLKFWRWEDGRYVPLSRTELTAEVTAAIKKEIDTVPLVDNWERLSSDEGRCEQRHSGAHGTDAGPGAE
jgi:hypothetical protein